MAAAGRKSNVWILISILLVIAAVFGGYELAEHIGQKAMEEQADSVNTDDDTEDDVGETDSSRDAAQTVRNLELKETELVIVVNYETGRIENLLLSVMRGDTTRLDFIRIAPEISYTMSSGLYAELIADNAKLPQTVTFTEIYKYYESRRAFEAAKRIFSELTGIKIQYYTALPVTEFEKYIYVGNSSGNFRAGFLVTRREAIGNLYGTPGSVKGILTEGLKSAETDYPAEERLKYLEVYDSLEGENSSFSDAPVIRNNESGELDVTGFASLMYGLLYE